MHATFKPHHFLDYLHEIAENNGVFPPVFPSGNAWGTYGNLLSAGKIDSVTFTSGADDPCRPCMKLRDGICTDIFPEAVAAQYGTDRKYDYNLKMDLTFIEALPCVFSPDTQRDIDEVYALLREKLTPEIILLNWPRKDRVELTFRGLEAAVRARRKAADSDGGGTD